MRYFHRLYWNDKNIEHIARHHVTPNEVEEITFSETRRIRKGKGEHIYYIFGQTNSGRYLFIVLLDLGGHSGKVITARDMSHKEKRWYRD